MFIESTGKCEFRVFGIFLDEIFVRQVRFSGFLLLVLRSSFASPSLFLRFSFALPSLQGRNSNIGFR
jgi:hypothetical protein